MPQLSLSVCAHYLVVVGKRQPLLLLLVCALALDGGDEDIIMNAEGFSRLRKAACME